MLLATTADQRFWGTDSRVLFLGEWCRLYSQKHIWSLLDHEVLPYHWDDREKLYQDYHLLDQIYESCLSQLVEQLNELHHTDFPTRYWRIIIGPWLFYFIQVVYDRYLSICAAEKSGKVTNVLLPKTDSTDWTAKDYYEFRDRVFYDPFNQFLYSEIIQFLGNLPYEITSFSPLSSPKTNTTSDKPLVNIVKKFFKIFGSLLPDKFNEIVFVNSYIKPTELILLQISLGQLPSPYQPTVETKSFPTDHAMRDKITIATGPTVFESLLQKIIPSLLPQVYMEGYQDMRQRAQHVFPGTPKVIYTTNALYAEEGFKFWTAWNTAQGTTLVTSQHGGHYGQAKWSAQEAHETQVADKYFTWGWEKENDPRITPMPSGQMISKIKNVKAKVDGYILWVGLGSPRYSYWLYSTPMGPQLIDYFIDQKRFAEEASEDVRRLLLYRLYSVEDFGLDQKKRLADLVPSVTLYEGPKSFYQQLNEARLCISTYNSSTYLEAFAADFPTLLFWNPNHWEVRPSAQPYFDELKEMKILHDTPESAASKLNTIYQDPLTWWQSPEIQKVRKRFCSRFARTSPHWISEWRTELKKLNID
jgi:putative transferase (TIGR04331 family)